jgi:hypothetical protein
MGLRGCITKPARLPLNKSLGHPIVVRLCSISWRKANLRRISYVLIPLSSPAIRGSGQINHYPILQKITTRKTLFFQTSSNHRTTCRTPNDKESGTNLMDQEDLTKRSNETDREDDTDFHLTNWTCRSYFVMTNSDSRPASHFFYPYNCIC